ncbi:DUF4145 domain-containing protein, partial [Bacillus cereus]|uniref:DUF4145 domain-containing protein n=1 Tax=Bacillus cereus TaxID=1396 RepID=UPI000DEFDF04
MIKFDKDELELESKIRVNFENNPYTCIIDNYVNQCPKCKHAIIPKVLGKNIFLDTKNTKYKLSFTFVCPSCFNSFIAQYIMNDLKYGYENSAKLDFVGPQSHSIEAFSEIIEEVSPDFVNFYNQALTAEQMGLTDIAGPGYRKSLEFLVKDFAKRNFPNDVSDIEKAPLAQCISKYLDNPNMQRVLQAATWIGNDQTHYKQKHEDRKLKDLKNFIKVSLSYVEL